MWLSLWRPFTESVVEHASSEGKNMLTKNLPAIVIVSLDASYRNVVAIAEEMGKLEVG